MGRAWKALLEVVCFLGLPFAHKLWVLCMVAANGDFRCGAVVEHCSAARNLPGLEAANLGVAVGADYDAYRRRPEPPTDCKESGVEVL